MNRMTRLSIKMKLLLLLVTLPVISLGLYLLLAIRLFETDKTAYVFDSSAAMSRTLASQTGAEIQSMIGSIKSIMVGFNVESRKFEGTSSDTFKNEPSITWLGVVGTDGSGTKVLFSELYRDQRSPVSFNENLLKFAEKSCQTGVALLPEELSGAVPDSRSASRTFFSQCIEVSKHVPLVAIALIEKPDLFSGFRNSSNYLSFLVDKDGHQLFGPEETSAQHFYEWNFFRSLQTQNLQAGTFDTRAPDGRDLFVSYSRIGVGGLLAVSMVEKQTALQAVEVLLKKSVLFLIALVSLAVLVSVFASNKLTSTLRELNSATRKVSEGQFDIQVHVRSSDEVGSLALNFNRMAGEVSRLMTENVVKARMEKELETARLVQETLFPESVAEIGPAQIAGHYEPASECGGDWWHYFVTGQRLFLWVGDVTGHGASAALLTSAARSASSVIQRIKEITPENTLQLLNQAIYETSKGSLHMTLFLAVLDLDTGEMSYSNASHNPPFLVHSGKSPPTAADLVSLDENNNPRLGEKSEHSFKTSKIRLKPGDTVWFYTDGVLDLKSSTGKAWGERNFIKSILRASAQNQSTEQMVNLVREACADFRKGNSLADDVTFFACRFGGPTT